MPGRRYIDSITRAQRSKRLVVSVDFRLTREECHQAFLYHATALVPETYLRVTPTTETLAHMLHTVAWLRGVDYIDHRFTDPDAIMGDPSQEAMDFAERCTSRLWNSKKLLVGT